MMCEFVRRARQSRACIFRHWPDRFRGQPDRLIQLQQCQIIGNARDIFRPGILIGRMSHRTPHPTVGHGTAIAPSGQKAEIFGRIGRLCIGVEQAMRRRQHQIGGDHRAGAKGPSGYVDAPDRFPPARLVGGLQRRQTRILRKKIERAQGQQKAEGQLAHHSLRRAPQR